MPDIVIQLDENQCNTCYACIRACPVKAIHVYDNSVYPVIDESQCISCGMCINACAYHAITYSDSTEYVETLLNSDNKVAAVCDPAIACEFDDINDYRKFVQMIRMLGFDYVNEMSFGVDVIAKKYKELSEDDFKGKYFITSHCPAIVELVQKFYPDLIDNMFPYTFPVRAAALAIRNIYGDDVKIVQLTPCIAAKKMIANASTPETIDAVLTFKELRKLFKKFHIKESSTEFSDFDSPLGYKGRLYPIPEGFIEASGLNTDLLNSKTITVSGMENTMTVIEQFLRHTETLKHNLNLFFCDGCVMGPGASKAGDKYLKHKLVLDYSQKRLARFDINQWQTNIQSHSHYSELTAHFFSHNLILSVPLEKDMKAALHQITLNNNNKEVNCGACGFETCRGLATAIARKIAIPEMCVTHSQMGNRNHSLNLRKTNELLENTRQELQKTTNELDENIAMLAAHTEALSIFVQRLNSGIVIVNEHLKVVDSNLSFVDMLGEEVRDIHEIIPNLVGADVKTLLPPMITSHLSYLLSHTETQINKDVEFDGKLLNVVMFQLIPNKLVAALFRNLHSKEERPEEIIHRVNEVIEANLRQVQQMGLILGEGAAKTEKMLNTIIKSYQ